MVVLVAFVLRHRCLQSLVLGCFKNVSRKTGETPAFCYVTEIMKSAN